MDNACELFQILIASLDNDFKNSFRQINYLTGTQSASTWIMYYIFLCSLSLKVFKHDPDRNNLIEF